MLFCCRMAPWRHRLTSMRMTLPSTPRHLTEGAAVALQLAVVPFGRASGARVNVAKSLGMLLGVVDSVELREQAQAVVGVPAFVAPGGHTRHAPRGVAVGWGCGGCCQGHVRQTPGWGVQFLRVRSWARFDLSYLGRVHVAKQVLANTFFFFFFFLS
jgi:hypothetical protein